MSRFRQRKAFTIVEMVIVIAVIAILATVLVPTISGVIQKANHSTDVQFAASLNVQLAMYAVDKPINNESDLRDAINYYYADKDENGNIVSDFYATMAPKSAKQGYHYWYDYKNGVVFVETAEKAADKLAEINGGSVSADVLFGTNKLSVNMKPGLLFFGSKNAPEANIMPLANGDKEFSPASLRSDLIDGLYLMGSTGEEGDLVDLITKFENLGNDAIVGSGSNEPQQQYEYAVNELLKVATEGTPAAKLLDKLQKTTIVTGEGAYRFNDVNAIEHVYVPLSATIINVQKIYEYVPGADGAAGVVGSGSTPSATVQLATHAKVPVVQIPVGVKIASNGFPAMSPCTDTTSASGNYESATVLEILTTNMADLTDKDGNFMFDVQTSNPVFRLLGGALHVMLEDKVYALPYNTGDASVEVGGTVGTGTLGNLEVKVEFGSTVLGEDVYYYDAVNKILYVQYDQTEVPITVTNGTYVTWEYSTDGTVCVSGDTLSILKKIAITDNDQVTVTGKINDEEKVSFTVCLVMPREVSVGTLDSTNDGVGVIGAKPIELVYDGINSSVEFDFAVNYGQNNKVGTREVSVSSEGDKFTPSLNADNTKLTITLKANTYEFEDVLKVTVGTETFSFTVKCTDQSGAAFDNALFYNDPSTEEYTPGKDIKIGENYLFRVGNKNGITLGQLFTTTKAYPTVAFKLYDFSYTGQPVIGKGSQTVDVGNATKADGKDYYTVSGADDQWKNVSLTFGKNGVVKIEIGQVKNGEFKKDATLLLEVVEGTNVTEYSQLTGSGNFVLWADIEMPENGTKAFSNCVLYGNGYTFDVQKGAYQKTTNGYQTEAYVISLSNATLDNVKIVGKVYTSISIVASKDYYRATVLLSGNSGIYNSYVSNCMSPVRVSGGNAVIENSTLKGGAFANLDIRGGQTTLKNVTTINQVESNDKASNGSTVIGMGIVLWYESVPDQTKLIIDGELYQYNYVSKKQAENITPLTVSGVNLMGKFVDKVFDSSLSKFHYNDGSTTWVNTGILSMNDEFDGSDIVKPSGEAYTPVNYAGAGVTAAGYNGYVCTMDKGKVQSGIEQNLDKSAPEWQPTKQKAIAPTYKFDYTSKNNVPQTQGSNDYCYRDTTSGKVLISMDAGDTFNWDTSILDATKDGNTLSYTVSMNGTDYTGKSIPFSASGEYIVVYTYTDSKNYDKNGDSYDVTYTHQVMISVSVVEANAKNAEFLFAGNIAGNKVYGSDNKLYISANVDATSSSWGSMKVGGKTIYYPIVNAVSKKATFNDEYQAFFPVFKDIISITDYKDNGLGDAVTYQDNGSSTVMPSGLTVVKGLEKNGGYTGDANFANVNDSTLNLSGPTDVFQWSNGAGKGSATPKYQNGVFSYNSPSGLKRSGNSYWIVQYSYQDEVGTVYYYYVGYLLKLDGSGDSGGGSDDGC